MDESDVVIDVKQNDPDRRKAEDLISAGQHILPGKIPDRASLLLSYQLIFLPDADSRASVVHLVILLLSQLCAGHVLGIGQEYHIHTPLIASPLNFKMTRLYFG